MMDVAEFDQRWFGLRALQQYLLENVELSTAQEVYDLMIGSAELVRDAGGDVREYIDSVCENFPCDPSIRAKLRDELWTKLSASL
jgi:hypothetical protein